MPHIAVANLDDDRLRVYRDLPRANLTALSGKFVVEGKWLVERLAASDFTVESVLVEEQQTSLIPSAITESTSVFVLPRNQIDQLIGFHFHRGILACGLRRPFAPLEELVPNAGPAIVVACVDIHDPTNLGGILRNCAGFGVNGVILGHNCADPFSRRVLRVSMGTAFRLRLAAAPNMETALGQLRSRHGCETVATVLDEQAEELESVTAPKRLVLLIGNEGHGLPRDLISQCDRRITLPMKLETDSLNAAAATAVFLYHFTRIGVLQRSDRATTAD